MMPKRQPIRSNQSADPKIETFMTSQNFPKMDFFPFRNFFVMKRGILIPINFYENPIKNSRIKFQFQKNEFWN